MPGKAASQARSCCCRLISDLSARTLGTLNYSSTLPSVNSAESCTAVRVSDCMARLARQVAYFCLRFNSQPKQKALPQNVAVRDRQDSQSQAKVLTRSSRRRFNQRDGVLH